MLGKLIRKCDVLFDSAVDACAVAAGVLIFLTMIGTSADVLGRYFLNRPIEEMMALSEFGLLYITFLSAPWLLRINGHIQMDFFISRMGIRKKSLLEIVSCVMGLFICLILIWYGTQVSRELWVMKVYDLFKMKGFPKAIIVAIIPFGSVLLFFQFLKNLIRAGKLLRETDGRHDPSTTGNTHAGARP
jgi:C4-dicarboxylate transporter DctQ subunit